MNNFDVIRAPKMSEKTLSLKEEGNQFAFEVDPKANKIQIKESVEKSFKVSSFVNAIIFSKNFFASDKMN